MAIVDIHVNITLIVDTTIMESPPSQVALLPFSLR